MRTNRTIVGVLLGVIAVACGAARAEAPKGGEARAAEGKGAKGDKEAQLAALVAAMGKYAAVGDEHKKLAAFEGTWDTEATVYLPSGEAVPGAKGTTEFFFLMNGLFLVEELNGTWMGKPISSHIVFGYDHAKKKYTWLFISSMRSEMNFKEGTADAAGKVFTLVGDSFDPVSGKRGPEKVVYTIESEKKFVITATRPRGGKDAKIMEVVFTRR
jgi:hypothetical protein